MFLFKDEHDLVYILVIFLFDSYRACFYLCFNNFFSEYVWTEYVWTLFYLGNIAACDSTPYPGSWTLFYLNYMLIVLD